MKKTLAIVAIGAAFVAVSFWVWLSKGKNAKVVKTKFRLGGALLTLTGMMTLGSCAPDQATCYEPAIECYDPAPVNEIYVEGYKHNTPLEVVDGGEIAIDAYGVTFEQLVVSIVDASAQVLQEEKYVMENKYDNQMLLTLNVAGYVGEADLIVSGIGEGIEEPVVLRVLELNITQQEESDGQQE